MIIAGGTYRYWTLLVPSYDLSKSTEIRIGDSDWQTVGELPKALKGASIANYENTVYLVGGVIDLDYSSSSYSKGNQS